MNNLIWICSYPKSGNTWVRSTIFAALMGEVSLNKFADVVPAFNASAMAETSNDNPDPLEREVLCWNNAQHVASSKASPKSQMFKTHNAAAVVNGVEFPNKELTSKAVYIVRDPRDIAVSYARQYSHDVNAAIEAIFNEKNYTFDVGRAEFFFFLGKPYFVLAKKRFSSVGNALRRFAFCAISSNSKTVGFSWNNNQFVDCQPCGAYFFHQSQTA